jgi:hypothetical protein
MPALLIDRRFQTCTDAELRLVAFELLRIMGHHGVKDARDLPAKYRLRAEYLRAELSRRGVQLRLFDPEDL